MAATLHPYYAGRYDDLARDFRARLDGFRPFLAERCGIGDNANWRDEFIDEFATVLSEIPFVGGSDGRMTMFFERMAGHLAIGRVLRRCGFDANLVGQAVMESFRQMMFAIPEAQRLEMGRTFMSPKNVAYLKAEAAKSHSGKYEGDFVYDIIDGDGSSFDFGIDYRECGFCKFGAKSGTPDMVPHMCQLDFESYRLRGIELSRTQTLAGGASHCNFRFKRSDAIK